MLMMSNWLRVTKAVKCPICEKPDWCMVSVDGKSAFCMRIANENLQPNGGYIHKLGCGIEIKRLPRKQKKADPICFAIWRDIVRDSIDKVDVSPLSDELGVSIDSLNRLIVGYHRGLKCWTFPMCNGRYQFIGIRTRGKGYKRAVRGSKNGLFIPRKPDDEELVIVEGPTDSAALLDIDIFAIGRASCNSCVNHTIEYVSRYCPKSIIIVADNDEAKISNGKKYYPGQDGAIALAKALPYKDIPIKIIKPIRAKDAREWKQKGLTKELFYDVVKNTRRFMV